MIVERGYSGGEPHREGFCGPQENVQCPPIPAPHFIFEDGDWDLQHCVKETIDFIGERNKYTCVPIDQDELDLIMEHVRKDEIDEEKRIHLLRLAQIMCRFDQYVHAYVFYYHAYCISSAVETEKRLYYSALLGLAKLLHTDVLSGFDQPKDISKQIFVYLDTLYPGEAASCFLCAS